MVRAADPAREYTGGASGTQDEAGRERRPREARLEKREEKQKALQG